jgi:hypothetical protein
MPIVRYLVNDVDAWLQARRPLGPSIRNRQAQGSVPLAQWSGYLRSKEAEKRQEPGAGRLEPAGH